MRVVVMGYSGSGKSTLARSLASAYSIPLLHMDRIQFSAGWRNRSIEEQHRLMRQFLDDNDSWVIDGNYTNLFFDERIDQSDVIVMLLFGRFTCLARAFKRLLTYRGVSRPSMADGCRERMDLEFMWWILLGGRDTRHRAQYRSILESHFAKTIVIRNQRQLSELSAARIFACANRAT